MTPSVPSTPDLEYACDHDQRLGVSNSIDDGLCARFDLRVCQIGRP
jgi:hypothetical protein